MPDQFEPGIFMQYFLWLAVAAIGSLALGRLAVWVQRSMHGIVRALFFGFIAIAALVISVGPMAVFAVTYIEEISTVDEARLRFSLPFAVAWITYMYVVYFAFRIGLNKWSGWY